MPIVIRCGGRVTSIPPWILDRAAGPQGHEAIAPPSARGSLPASNPPAHRADQVRVADRPSRSPTVSTRYPAAFSAATAGAGTSASAIASGRRALRRHAADQPAGRRDGVGRAACRAGTRAAGPSRRSGAARSRPSCRRRLEAPVALHDHRHQRVRRPRAGQQAVRVAGLEREARAPVVRHDAGPRLEESRAEAVEEALDQRDPAALGVGGHERDRVARPVLRDRGRPGHARAHLVGQRAEVPVVEQGRRVHAHPVGVGEVAVAIARRGAQHVGEHAGVGPERVGVEAEPLDDRERLEQHEPLGVRRMHEHVDVAEAARSGVPRSARCPAMSARSIGTPSGRRPSRTAAPTSPPYKAAAALARRSPAGWRRAPAGGSASPRRPRPRRGRTPRRGRGRRAGERRPRRASRRARAPPARRRARRRSRR